MAISNISRIDDAIDLATALTTIVNDYRGHILYVELEDGSLIRSCHVSSTILSDKSVVFNIVLGTEEPT